MRYQNNFIYLHSENECIMELFKRQIKDFNITQIPSNDGKNFPTLHKVIHQVKSWIRGIYSWVSEFNIDRYLAEYSFRINRSQNKDTIFNKLMKRLIERKPIFQSQLVCP